MLNRAGIDPSKSLTSINISFSQPKRLIMKILVWNLQYKMEEKMKVFYVGQELSLTLQQIINLQPFVKQEHVKKLKLTATFNKFELNLQVLHACLYYLISVEKAINSLITTNFREKCLTAMQSYYIQRKMNFQLYEYGYLCSKLLSYSLEKSLHIIYFLIYARLASKPYIVNIISQAQKFRKYLRKQTCKSEKDEKATSVERDSRHLTVFMENGQIQVENFKKDIKKIFNSHPDMRKTYKRIENKRYFNLKKLYPEEDFQYKFQQSFDDFNMKNEIGRTSSIPLKVGAYDHSSVINRLKFHSRKANSGGSFDLHKNMVRRQKFKEQFNACEKCQAFKKQQKQQRNQWVTSKVIAEDKLRGTSNISRILKHPYQYFKDITLNIKSCNRQLDVIRSECINNKLININSNIMSKQEGFHPKNAISYTGVSTPTLTANSSEKILLNLSKLKFQDTQNHSQILKARQQGLKTQNSPKKGYQKLKTQATPRANDVLNEVITRKNDKVNQQNQQIILSNKSVKGKFKLQKYKEQYRHFLKNQLFEKIKNS